MKFVCTWTERVIVVVSATLLCYAWVPAEASVAPESGSPAPVTVAPPPWPG